MPKERRFGDGILISTSCHLSVGTLKLIAELDIGQSKFIREAVNAHLETKSGLYAIIKRFESQKEELEEKLSNAKRTLKSLRSRAEKVGKIQNYSLLQRREQIIRDAISNVHSYKSPEDVLEDIKPTLDLPTKKSEKEILAVIDKIWREIRG